MDKHELTVNALKQAWKKVLQQPGLAIDSQGCAYQTEEGYSCVIGWLLREQCGLQDVSHLTGSVLGCLNNYVEFRLLEPYDIRLLDQSQGLHDYVTNLRGLSESSFAERWASKVKTEGVPDKNPAYPVLLEAMRELGMEIPSQDGA